MRRKYLPVWFTAFLGTARNKITATKNPSRTPLLLFWVEVNSLKNYSFISLMGNGCSTSPEIISQPRAKHENDFDPTRHCEIKSAELSPRGIHSPLGQKSIISRRNLHLPVSKMEGRDEAVRKASKVHSSCTSGYLPQQQLVLHEQYVSEEQLWKQIPPSCCPLPDGGLSL